MILQIKTQGFPSIIKDLGVQSPLSGPFWGFEPTVIPTYQIGDLSVKLNAAQPYFPADIDTDSATDPGDNQALAVSPALPAGRYAIEAGWTFGVGAANGSQMSFAVISSAVVTLRQYFLEIMGPAAGSRQYGSAQRFFVEDLYENDHIELINQTQMLGSTLIRSYLKWYLIGSLPFKTG